MSSWSLRLCLLVACLCVLPLPSSAQAPAPPAGRVEALIASGDYTAVIKEAVAEFEDDHFAESRALFARAHELQPSARTWRGLGISAFALRDYPDAVVALESALASKVRPLEGGLRHETEELLHRSYGFVGRYVLGLDPVSAQLSIDDVESGHRSGDRLLLSIGRHRLEARAPAYVSDLRAIDVTGGEETGLSFTLVHDPVVAAPVVLAPAAAPVVATPAEAAQTVVEAPVPDAEREPGAPLYKNPWLWAGVGAAVVVIVVAASVAGSRDRTEVGGIDANNTHSVGTVWVP